jgi:hypothetical protein
LVYGKFLRPLVVKAVEDPNSDWDETLMKMLDGLFGYKP